MGPPPPLAFRQESKECDSLVDLSKDRDWGRIQALPGAFPSSLCTPGPGTFQIGCGHTRESLNMRGTLSLYVGHWDNWEGQGREIPLLPTLFSQRNQVKGSLGGKSCQVWWWSWCWLVLARTSTADCECRWSLPLLLPLSLLDY